MRSKNCRVVFCDRVVFLQSIFVMCFFLFVIFCFCKNTKMQNVFINMKLHKASVIKKKLSRNYQIAKICKPNAETRRVSWKVLEIKTVLENCPGNINNWGKVLEIFFTIFKISLCIVMDLLEIFSLVFYFWWIYSMHSLI